MSEPHGVSERYIDCHQFSINYGKTICLIIRKIQLTYRNSHVLSNPLSSLPDTFKCIVQFDRNLISHIVSVDVSVLYYQGDV